MRHLVRPTGRRRLRRRGRRRVSDTSEQLLVAVVFVFPVSVWCCEAAFRATTAKVKPLHVFAVFIERNPDGDLEFLVTAGAGAFLELGVLEVFIAITDRMLGSAGNASGNSRAHWLVQFKPKQIPTTLALRVREVVGDVGV